jgi:hypothetical protein
VDKVVILKGGTETSTKITGKCEMGITEVFETVIMNLSKYIVKAGRIRTRGCKCFAKLGHKTVHVLAFVPKGT